MRPDRPLRDAFLNPREGRLRAGWRLAVTTGLFVVALLLSVPLVSALAGPGGVDGTALISPAGLVAFVLPTAALLVAARAVDRRTLGEFGLSFDRGWWADLLAGLALGISLPAVIFAVEYALGFVRVVGVLGSPGASPPAPSASAALALAFGYFVGVSVLEEALFRGYLLTNVAEGLTGLGSVGARGGVTIAVAATSLLFGLGHGLNPNATPLAVVIIALYGGLLAAGYLLTGRLALPIGIHAAWNFAVSSVFGFPVSGIGVDVSVLVVEQSGPRILTGGSFGPEGGLISLLGLVLGTALVLAWVRRREGAIHVHPDIARPPVRAAERERE